MTVCDHCHGNVTLAPVPRSDRWGWLHDDGYWHCGWGSVPLMGATVAGVRFLQPITEPPDPDTALTYDEVEAEGLDGSLRF